MAPLNTLWTVGHSTRSITEFIALLQHYRLETLVDVRRFPGSRRLPQFGQAQLEASLGSAGINYQSMKELGGRRRPDKDSVNIAWRNTGFRGYADYMSCPDFQRGLDNLCAIAAQSRTVIMCAEVLWWRCHRSMIADAVMVRGIKVIHIRDVEHRQEHPYTQPARLYHGHLSYQSNLGMPLNQRTRQQEHRPH